MTQTPQTHHMTPDEFAHQFNQIRFNLNWRAFQKWRWPIRTIVISEREALLALRTGFRMRYGRLEPHFLKTVMSHYMSVGQVVNNLDRFSDRRQKIFSSYHQTFAEAKEPIDLQFAAYDMGQNRQLILDGNHRACALALADVRFQVTLFSIVGPRWFIPQ